jgi:hypothetical protein
MSIISGQDTRLQIGLADTWKQATKTKQRVPYTTEGFKGTPNYKASDALVGASGITSMAIMSFTADGSFSTYVPVDLFKLLMFAALGTEANPVVAGSQFKHLLTPISSGLCANLPSLTVEVDRILEKALYPNFKITDWKLSASAEDYAMLEVNGPAFKEDLQTVIFKCIGATVLAPGPTVTFVPPVGSITAGEVSAGIYTGKIVRATLPNCGQVFYFKIDTYTTGLITMTPMTAWGMAGAPSTYVADLTGATMEILDWEMAPNVPMSSLEYLRFVHGYLYMDETVAPFKSLGTGQGKAGDKVVDVPVPLTGAEGLEIRVSAYDLQGVPRVYKFIGTPLTGRAGTILTFADSGTAPDAIRSIFVGTAFQSTHWVVDEVLYAEATEFTLSGDNKIATGQFGMNGSMYQSEVNPTSREFSIELSARFTQRLSELRRQRMMTGAPVSIKLILETRIAEGPEGEFYSSVDSNGLPYKVVVTMKKCYYVDGIPNITGPDEPTVSPKFTCAETPGVHKAIEIEIYDDKNHTVSAGDWAKVAREDGY